MHNDYQRTSSVKSMMDELGWKPLVHRRREQRLILLSKSTNGLVPMRATDHIAFNTISPRSRHQGKQIKVVATDSEIHRNSFSPRTIKDWNLLPESVLNADAVFQEFHFVLLRHLHTPTLDNFCSEIEPLSIIIQIQG